MTNQNRYITLTELLGEDKVLLNESMAKHTTFRIGGPVDCFVTPETMEQVKEVVQFAKEENIPFYVIGNGSNILVGDQGYRGIIIQIGKQMSKIELEHQGDEWYVEAEAGVMLSKLAMTIANQGLTGFEFAAGIPGTLGGAITMNAGAYGGEIKDHIVQAVVMNQKGEIRTRTKEELNLSYRHSVIQDENEIVLCARFQFSEGDKETILAEIKELNMKRKEKQPLEYPSAGSTFKRPEGYFAGKLIMDANLRGYRVGDIMVAEKHCGFVINVGDGTAKQVRQLINDVQEKVYQQFGVTLEPEVRFVGEF